MKNKVSRKSACIPKDRTLPENIFGYLANRDSEFKNTTNMHYTEWFNRNRFRKMNHRVQSA
jgi:hypothetical protein